MDCMENHRGREGNWERQGSRKVKERKLAGTAVASHGVPMAVCEVPWTPFHTSGHFL